MKFIVREWREYYIVWWWRILCFVLDNTVNRGEFRNEYLLNLEIDRCIEADLAELRRHRHV